MSRTDPHPDPTQRAETLRMLEDFGAARPDQASVVARFRELITRREDAFVRSCFTPGHLTGAAWILSPERDAWALLLHRKLDRWLQPGGHADGDADLLAVARKEAEEETGLRSLQALDGITGLPADRPSPLDLDIHAIPAHAAEPAHEHFDVRFLFHATDPSEALQISVESHDLRWVGRTELDRFTEEDSVLRLEKLAAAILR